MVTTSRIKRIESPDGKSRVDILDTGGGLFRFSRSSFMPSQDDVDRTFHGEGYWSFESPSGLYASAEEAEAGARAATSWMQGVV